jgi:hypothetical protein
MEELSVNMEELSVNMEKPSVDMEEIVFAAQTNDLDKLRRCIDQELAQAPIPAKGMPESTKPMQAACAAAAHYNHTAAVDLLLDSGCWVDTRKDTLHHHYMRVTKCFEIQAIVLSTLNGRSKEVIDRLIARGWDVNSSESHLGDLLL